MKEIPPVGNANRLQVLRENNFEKGQEIATHVKEKHGGGTSYIMPSMYDS